MPRASMLSHRNWLAVLASLGATLLATPAHAFERQWHLGGGAGVVWPPAAYSLGPALSAHAAYGLSDVFDLRLEVLASRHGRDGWPSASLLSGAGGIAYKLDIIEWVPYAGLMAGYAWSDPDLPAAEGPHRAPLLGLLVGVDYGFSRSFGLGVAVREDLLLTSGRSQGAALLRAEYRWGW